MPRFRYTATNEKGKTVRGLLEAPSEEALYAKLRNDGLYMTDAQEAQKAHATFRPLKTAVLADFCRNLSSRVGNAGAQDSIASDSGTPLRI